MDNRRRTTDDKIFLLWSMVNRPLSGVVGRQLSVVKKFLITLNKFNRVSAANQ